jgi:hypothetical protein
MKHDRILSGCLMFACLTIALSVIPATRIEAIDWDWGGSVDNTTVFGFSEMYDETRITQTLKLGVWGMGLHRIQNGGSITLTGAAGYRATDERPYIFDVDMLRVAGRFPGSAGPRSLLLATAGRTRFADPTGLILDHTADGGIVRIIYPGVQLRLAGAYTGLLISPSSVIRISQTDYFEAATDDEFFGPRRLIGLFDASFGRISLFTVAQFDLRDDAEADSIDTQYFGITGAGRAGDSVYTNSFLVVSTGQTRVGYAENQLLSLAIGGGARWFAEHVRFSRVSLRGLVATPFLPLEDDIGVNISEFKPITEPSLGLVFQPRLSNLIFTEMDYSLRPFAGPLRTRGDSIQFTVAGRGFFRAYTGDSDYVDKLDPESDSLYLGTEIELGIHARVFSDLGLALRTGVFLPGNGSGGAFSSERRPEWAVRLDLSSGF